MTSDAYRAALHAIPESLLSDLQAAGAWLEAGGVRAPRGALTASLRESIRQYRDELRLLEEWRSQLLAEDRERGEAYMHEEGRDT